MKITFHCCKIVTAGLFIFFSFPSFAQIIRIVGRDTIRIVGGNTTSGKLNLIDSSGKSADTFLVDLGHEIYWEIVTDEVDEITEIRENKKGHTICSTRGKVSKKKMERKNQVQK